MAEPAPKTGLALLREPFPLHQISKLPKATSDQTQAVKADRSLGIRCKECGQWHHKNTVHLDYVGHAALTDRLLDCDPHWNWEPAAFTADGNPMLDNRGGMWIKLTVCGLTRLGYGHADGKSGGDAVKEVIGDALRNAAMRFGAALDLWHKGDLHGPDDEEPAPKPKSEPRRDEKPKDPAPSADQVDHAVGYITDAETLADLKTRWTNLPPAMRSVQAVGDAKDARKTALEAAPINPNEAPF